MLCHIDKTFCAALRGNPVFYAGEVIDVPESHMPAWQRAGLLHPVETMSPGDIAGQRESPRAAEREIAARLRAPNTRKRR